MAMAADARANGNGAAPPAGRRSARGRRQTGPSPPDVVEAAARRLRVMGHPVRLRLIELLADGPQSVTELAAALGIEHQLISKHLNELHRCDVVTRRQDGNSPSIRCPMRSRSRQWRSFAGASSRIEFASPRPP